MPFAKHCLEHRGKTVGIKPIHAYGWSRLPKIEGQVDYEPAPFTLTISDFVVWQDTLVALHGKIEQPGHDYHGYWVTAVPRIDQKTIDFDSALGPCGLVISPEQNVFDASRVPPNHPDAVLSRSQPVLRGHGMLVKQLG